MVNHGPKNLDGPVSRTSAWWTVALSGEPVSSSEASTANQEDRPIRHELVERVRREIADGTYETSEKWKAALDRLFRTLEQE